MPRLDLKAQRPMPRPWWAERPIAVLQGLHSRIPLCCIRYFTTVYMPTYFNADAGIHMGPGWERVMRRIRKAAELARADVQYVPCPACVRSRRFVRIHVCSRRCRGIPGAVVR
jgi:hypothetical protein